MEVEMIIDIVLVFFSIVLARDDYGAYYHAKKVSRENISKVKKRNDILEAILKTKAHQNNNKEIDTEEELKNLIPYCVILLLSVLLVLLDNVYFNCGLYSRCVTVIALIISILLKHLCNRMYDELSRPQ